MNTNKAIATAAISGVLALGLSACGGDKQQASSGSAAEGETVAAADNSANEKCFGLAKKGMNDCAANGHSCAGQAKADGDAKEWIYVPKGSCDKIVGATTSA